MTTTATDTIVAVATPPGRGGIAVVRISGPEAFAVAGRLLERPVTLTPRQAVLARIAVPFAPAADAVSSEDATCTRRGTREADRPTPDGHAIPSGDVTLPRAGTREAARQAPSGQSISSEDATHPPAGTSEAERQAAAPGPGSSLIRDEAVVLPFAAPASYTGEPVVEISVHGSIVIAAAVVGAAVRAGARPARPGEFTLRAFLNGRLDLAQAEAVRDLVEAATPLQARVAFDQLTGTLSGRIAEIERELFALSARLEASIDFPDEGYRFVAPGEVAAIVRAARERVEALAGEGRRGRLVREGATVAIVGRTNVGKSTLFNQLVGHERAIVAEIPGTTRDVLTETVTLEGLRVTLVDTAGVRDSADPVEREGVSRAGRALAAADLAVVVLDGSELLQPEDRRLLEETSRGPRVLVRNKSDRRGFPAFALEGAQGPGGGAGEAGGCGNAGARPGAELGAGPVVDVSAVDGVGLKDLIRSINREIGWTGPWEPPALSNARHIELLGRVAEALAAAEALLTNATAGDVVPEEIVLSDLQRARAALEEVTGRRTTEDLLGEIFSSFCIGK